MNRNLRPGERKILEKLKEWSKREKGLSFTKIEEKTSLSRSVLSDYLKQLQKSFMIKRDIDSRKYMILKPGQEALKKGIISDKTSNLPYHVMEIETEVSIERPRRFFSADSVPVPFTQKKIVVEAVLHIDKEHESKLDSVVKNLQERNSFHFVYPFFKHLGDVLSTTYGYEYPSGPVLGEYWKARDMIEKEQYSLDYEAVLQLRFNGKEVAKSIDWEDLMKSVEEGDKLDEEKFNQLKAVLTRDKEARKAYAKRHICLDLSVASQRSTQERKTEHWIGVNHSDLENRFARHIQKILSSAAFPKIPSEKEIKKMLKELKEKGIIEIVHDYTFNVKNEKALNKILEESTRKVQILRDST